jgi:hypothetical protein
MWNVSKSPLVVLAFESVWVHVRIQNVKTQTLREQSVRRKSHRSILESGGATALIWSSHTQRLHSSLQKRHQLRSARVRQISLCRHQTPAQCGFLRSHLLVICAAKSRYTAAAAREHRRVLTPRLPTKSVHLALTSDSPERKPSAHRGRTWGTLGCVFITRAGFDDLTPGGDEIDRRPRMSVGCRNPHPRYRRTPPTTTGCSNPLGGPSRGAAR